MKTNELENLRRRIVAGLIDDLRMFRLVRCTIRQLLPSHPFFASDLDRCLGAISDIRERAKNRKQFYRAMVVKYGLR